LPTLTACEVHKGGNVPSPLFNFLFLVSLFVPAAMSIGGVIILMISVVVKHYSVRYERTHSIEALAH
jgi:hypothetical protein